MLSQSSQILLAFRARIFDARHLTETQGKIRKRVLLTTKCRLSFLVFGSQPMKVSLDLTFQAAEPLRGLGLEYLYEPEAQPKQATGRSAIKAMYLR